MAIEIHDMSTLHIQGHYFFSGPCYLSLPIGLLMLCTKPILQLILTLLMGEVARSLVIIYSHCADICMIRVLNRMYKYWATTGIFCKVALNIFSINYCRFFSSYTKMCVSLCALCQITVRFTGCSRIMGPQ